MHVGNYRDNNANALIVLKTVSAASAATWVTICYYDHLKVCDYFGVQLRHVF